MYKTIKHLIKDTKHLLINTLIQFQSLINYDRFHCKNTYFDSYKIYELLKSLYYLIFAKKD